MMKDMDKKGDLPLSLLAAMGKPQSGSSAPRRASSPGSAAPAASRHAAQPPAFVQCLPCTHAMLF